MIVPTAWRSGPAAVTSGMMPGTSRALADLAQEQAAHELIAQIQKLHGGEVRASAKLFRGNPVSLIPRRAKDIGADLVVLGTHGRAGTEAFWQGSLTSKLVGKLTCSVLLVPAGE